MPNKPPKRGVADWGFLPFARLIAWLERVVTPFPRIKGQPVTPRPPAPRTTGYQPCDTGPQAPPPHGGSSAMPPRLWARPGVGLTYPAHWLALDLPPCRGDRPASNAFLAAAEAWRTANGR